MNIGNVIGGLTLLCPLPREVSSPSTAQTLLHILNSIQNFEIGCIQFNKIFIQLENMGIEQG